MEPHLPPQLGHDPHLYVPCPGKRIQLLSYTLDIKNTPMHLESTSISTQPNLIQILSKLVLTTDAALAYCTKLMVLLAR